MEAIPPSRRLPGSTRRAVNVRRWLPVKSCGYCGWSWASGNRDELICMNPESPHAYDTVPMDLSCPEQDVSPSAT